VCVRVCASVKRRAPKRARENCPKSRVVALSGTRTCPGCSFDEEYYPGYEGYRTHDDIYGEHTYGGYDGHPLRDVEYDEDEFWATEVWHDARTNPSLEPAKAAATLFPLHARGRERLQWQASVVTAS
jgi:hypothetical protein